MSINLYSTYYGAEQAYNIGFVYVRMEYYVIVVTLFCRTSSLVLFGKFLSCDNHLLKITQVNVTQCVVHQTGL